MGSDGLIVLPRSRHQYVSDNIRHFHFEGDRHDQLVTLIRDVEPGPLGDAAGYLAETVNRDGDVAGRVAGGGPLTIWHADGSGAEYTIPWAEPQVSDMNNRGQVLGWGFPERTGARKFWLFRLSDGVTPLTSSVPGTGDRRQGRPVAMNDKGALVGSIGVPGDKQAAYWTHWDARPQTLALPSLYQEAEAWTISNLGAVSGASTQPKAGRGAPFTHIRNTAAVTTTPARTRPRIWPSFSSPLRSTAVTARLGRALGICFAVCFVTGLLSHYQYGPWTWLPQPANPVWGYRLTQGLHVITGIAAIPLTLVKLWSVYPNLFRWPALKSVKHAAERASVAILVSASLVQLVTGFLNVLGWYVWPWDFVAVHRFLAYVIIGSILLHIGIKLPDIKYGLQAKVADADVLTEVPWSENPAAHTNAGHVPPPTTPAITRRGLLIGTRAGVGIVVATSVGQTLTPLEPIGLLAIREPSKGPQGVPVNKTAASAGITEADVSDAWALTVVGANGFTMSLDEIESMSEHVENWPINCVEGWSVGAQWQGLRLLDLVARAGGNADSRVRVASIQQGGFNESYLVGPQVSVALLATHVNSERLNLDHGYPLRLIAPYRAGVLNTKWLNEVEIY